MRPPSDALPSRTDKKMKRNSRSEVYDDPYAGRVLTNGRWGGKLPRGNAAWWSPDFSLSAAARKAATNSE
jgi:hypothetical protein